MCVLSSLRRIFVICRAHSPNHQNHCIMFSSFAHIKADAPASFSGVASFFIVHMHYCQQPKLSKLLRRILSAREWCKTAHSVIFTTIFLS
jgi:hypothetical protein